MPSSAWMAVFTRELNNGECTLAGHNSNSNNESCVSSLRKNIMSYSHKIPCPT